MLAKNIDEVLATLENIIEETKQEHSPLGYFAALYQTVTKKVKEGIENNYFDNSERMELLDVVFANRYIIAYYNYKAGQPISKSWDEAFTLSTHYWPIVLQHLLISMNAHINLDLGIAAAVISKNTPIDELEGDFNKINHILSSLVQEIEEKLSNIWPTLKKVLKFTQNADDFLVDFSMELAREGAWRFAKTLHNSETKNINQMIAQRDLKVAQKAHIISEPGFIVSFLFSLMRLGEKGSVTDKISVLNA